MRLFLALAFLCMWAPVASAFGQDEVVSKDPFLKGIENGSINGSEDKALGIYWQGHGWTVVKSASYCAAYALTVEEEMFFLSYHPKYQSYVAQFTNKKATSLEDNSNHALQVAFFRGSRISKVWEDIEFTAHVEKDGIRLMSEGLSESFGLNFAKSDMISLWRINGDDDAVWVAGIELSGSAKANAKLRECSFKQSGLNPNDPFLQ